ncbi:hypothetical protein V1525DRAFT_117414 [Lipomyces kononenkoae]|uniref:Uncharacterized protein n=1 Tax=Lipomyces kononenkoae TaxID=34357 RepID=A0ACC3T2Z6_LIPKO
MVGLTADAYAQRLSDASADAKTKLPIATELRDSLETFQQPQEYPKFLSKVMPVLISILESLPPSFLTVSPEQKLRNCLLEVIHRLQMNEPFRQYAVQVMQLLMSLLRIENEENGVLCMKIITGLHRTYKATLGDHVQPFLDLVVEVYKNMPAVVKETFEPHSSSMSQTLTNVSTPGNLSFQSPRPMSPSLPSDIGGDAPAKTLPKSMFSFRVLTECPIIVVLLFSTHKQSVNDNLPVFVPLIIEMLSLQAAPQAEAHTAAASRGEIYTSVSPAIKNRTAFGEFITAQVKTMSFLAYVLRGFAPALKKYHSLIPDFVIRLLKDCPRELSASRKELLVATRHILSTDFRTIFIPKVDLLLNEQLLIGDGLTVHETLRPLAYSMVADLLHHVRAELTPAQIWLTVEVYSKNLLDNTLAASFQTMSAKLLLNLVERIMKLPNKAEGRQLVVFILDAFAEKFAALNRNHDNALSHSSEKVEKRPVDPIASITREEEKGKPLEYPDEAEMENGENGEQQKDLDHIDIFTAFPIKLHADTTADGMKDGRYLFKNLLNGLKTIMFGLKTCNPPPTPDIAAINPAQWNETARGFSYEQVAIFRKLFREGANGFSYYATVREKPVIDTHRPASYDSIGPNIPITSSKEEKELLETFATVFIHIDPAAFHEVLEPDLPYIFDAMLRNPSLLHVPQFFLASEPTSANFAGILLKFLMERLEEIGQGDPLRANLLIRLFKLSFMAVNLFSTTNEEVFQPHLRNLILKCMSLATTAEDPLNYYLLLRTLFRSIGGGRFELLYKEVLPLLQVLLESLNRLLLAARKPQERDLYVELCLTVPVRLSVLVPHLKYLMRPLVISLTGSQDLISQGLRTLELCVDNLTPDYFDNIVEPVIEEVMEALWTHLKPLPYPHQPSHTTLRILGKLGGRNRRFLEPPKKLNADGAAENEASIMIDINGLAGRRAFPLAAGLDAVFRAVMDYRGDIHYRVEAFHLLATTARMFIDRANLGPDPAQVLLECVKAIKTGMIPPDPKFSLQSQPRSTRKLHAQNDMFLKILNYCFNAVAISKVRDEAITLINDICEHVMMLEIGKVIMEVKRDKRPFLVTDHEDPLCIDFRLLYQAISDALGSYKAPVREAGMDAIRLIYKTCVSIFGTPEAAQKFPVFKMLVSVFCHSCFEEQWYNKAGGCLGLKVLLTECDFSREWVLKREIDMIRALLFVLKDIPPELPSLAQNDAQDLIKHILNVCNTNITREEMSMRLFHQVLSILFYEVSNSHLIVRETVQSSLRYLATLTNVPLHELLGPVKATLLVSIFGKPLRALPFPMQIGNIDAITFCLSLENSFLPFNDELLRLLMEALALADADDEALLAAPPSQRVMEYGVFEQLVQLRIVCMRLLTLAMMSPEFFQDHPQQQAQTRAKIIGVFFKTLYSRSKKVVEAANEGLKAVLSQNHKLPKDLLQTGLRPILMNLSDHRRLTIAGLDGLAILLELLTNYFKIEIGTKLLDHLKAWAEPSLLYQSSGKQLMSQHNIKIIAAIMNIYHLLPAEANRFMDGLVTTVIYLEEHLRRYRDSPFRPALVKFTARYPKETMEYFAPKLADRRFGKIFVHLAKDDRSTELRMLLIARLPTLISRALEIPNADDKCGAVVNMIYIVGAVARQKKEWIVTQKDALLQLLQNAQWLRQFARSRNLTSSVHLGVKQALEELLNIFLIYMEANEGDTDMIFKVIDAIATKTIEPTAAIYQHIFENLVRSESVERRRLYLNKSLDFFNHAGTSAATRCFIFQYLINSMLIMEVHRKGDLSMLIEKSWIETVHSKIWKPALSDLSEDISEYQDQYRIQLLQMSATLIHHSPTLVAEVRKDIIKVGWNYIKLEDVISKQAASVLIAFFIVAYDTPLKIALQIYVQLLKAHHSDARVLVKQALDLLAPVLPKRLGSEGRFPLWSKYARRVLAEDGHNVSQVINVYQFIVRHPELFYESRDHFFNLIVTAMPKLGFMANSPSENQVLSVDLAELILKWEKTRVEKTSALEESMDGISPSSPESRKRRYDEMQSSPGQSTLSQETKAQSPGPADSKTEILVPFLLREATITYLIRFACISPNKATESLLTKRIIDILHDLLGPGLWSEVNVKLTFFERSLAQNTLSSTTLVSFINALQVIRVTLDQKSDEWILANLEQLQKLLNKSIHSDIEEVQECLQPVLGRVLKATNASGTNNDDSVQEVVSSFLSMITSIIQENFTASQALVSSVLLACTLTEYRPQSVDPLLPVLMRTFGKLCKDHIMPNVPPVSQAAAHAGQPSSGTAAAASTATQVANGAAGNGTPNGHSANGKPAPAPAAWATAATSSNTPDASGSQDASHSDLDPKKVVVLLKKILKIGADRISHLEDQRRIYLNVVSQLVERSNDIGLCFNILEIVRAWIFSNPELFPLLKEKTAILSKMLIFEIRGDASLTKAFYQLVVDIYEAPSLVRSELTVRMEHAFLAGTRVGDVPIRKRFMEIFSNSLDKSLWKRFMYVVKDQNWESLADTNWLNQATQLLFGSIEPNSRLSLGQDDFLMPSFNTLTNTIESKGDNIVTDEVDAFFQRRRTFISTCAGVTANDFFGPLMELFYYDVEAIRQSWCAFFPIAWSTVSVRDRQDVSRNFTVLLTKDFHARQMDKNPNYIQMILEGIGKCNPPIQLSPNLIKFLGKSYNGWYAAVQLLEEAELHPQTDSNPVRESNLDALVELYASLQEDDMFYGQWRRRCQYIETNTAISYEQLGLWNQAQQMYETAQIKARSGALPYSESEYILWEDHWILSAEKLQQWDILSELAKHEGFTDLLLECAWRMADWTAEKEPLEQSIKSVMDVPTPRRYIFEAFMYLQKFSQKPDSPTQELSKCCDEGIQLTLRKWNSLPKVITKAHIPLLQAFQQFVELLEASQLYKNLATTDVNNVETKSQEMKVILQAWRERLPNMWDDINVWGDLVAWRQHVFSVINKYYLPLVPQIQAQYGNNSTTNSTSYRGYHEIAWIINRFAHVARKHGMTDVCIGQLTKIYSLPNIEIQEAFLKLREQAKCHYQNPNELRTGLDVISNTNLIYFTSEQKAEFFTLKAMFFAKLEMYDDANQTFSNAVQIDFGLSRSWAEWAYFHDCRFKATGSMNHAAHAISCYMQAAALYRNGKVRRFLGRILWLISLDDSSQALSQAFDSFTGDVPVWYWITYIPQLLTSLSHKEARLVRRILIRIAKSYPQALHFSLRTTKEDYSVLQRQAMQATQREANRQTAMRGAAPGTGGVRNSPSLQQATVPGSPMVQSASGGNDSASPQVAPGTPANAAAHLINRGNQPNAVGSPSTPIPATQTNPTTPLQPWEYVDEILGILKTAYPLLSLSMETFVDQIYQRFKCSEDEDAYRLVVALLSDGVQYMGRLPFPKDDTRLPPAAEVNISKFADSILPKYLKSAFEADFVHNTPNIQTYVSKLRRWRDRFEEKLDRRQISEKQNLESLSPHLSEFHYQKFDDIDVPGQYLLHKDSNAHFVKIERFLPKIDIVRVQGLCYRRITIRGSDTRMYPFTIQYPAARHCRREERITQLFRILNSNLVRRTESRRRNLQFYLAAAVPLSPHFRLVQDSPDFVSLQSIYEDYCHRTGRHRDDPLMFTIQKLRQAVEARQGKTDVVTDRIDVLSEIQNTMVPGTIVRDHFMKTFSSFSDFWLFRKEFAYSYAGVAFMTYMMCLNLRLPYKLLISQTSGEAWATETLPSLPSHTTTPAFFNPEPVPFRLTPNLQNLMGPTALEGLFSPSMMIYAKCLTLPEFDLEQYLTLFVRDEIISWYTFQHRPCAQDQQLQEIVKLNVEVILKKTSSLAQPGKGTIPANQTVIDLVAQAVNPKHLALTDNAFMPYL